VADEVTVMDFEQQARQAADHLNATRVRPPAVADALRRGRRRRALRATGGALAVLATFSLVSAVLVRAAGPDRQTAQVASAGPLGGRWTLVVPGSVATAAQVPSGPWTVTVTATTLTFEPVGRSGDRIVERVSFAKGAHRLLVRDEDPAVAFNFACASGAAYTWVSEASAIRLRAVTERCTSRRLVLTLPWQPLRGR
jgi:hypothetical protein